MHITQTDLKKLAGFSSDQAWVVSLYLNVDGAKYPRPQDYKTEFKAFVNQAERQWLNDRREAPRDKKQWLKQDLEKISNFVMMEWARGSTKGLVVFGCAAEGLWQVYELPVAIPSALIIGNEPYAKTLTAVLDEYKRFCVVAVDRKKYRIFTVFLGGIEEHYGVFVDEMVPDQVKEGDWANLRESRISRHINDHVMHHLKDVARETFNFFLAHDFDRLILAGHHEMIPKFTALLHPYLAERVVGRFTLDIDAPLSEFLEKSLAVEEQVQEREEKALISRLREQNAPGLLAVSGLEPTIQALMRGQADTLLVADTQTMSGYVCYKDHYLSAKEEDCPVCGRALSGTDDIIEDMIQLAINQNVKIEHIFHDPDFKDKERIGALLRFGWQPQAQAG